MTPVALDARGALACPDCGWTTSPDAPNPRRSLEIHAAHCRREQHESPAVLRDGRWLPGRHGIRVWVPREARP